LPKAFTIAEPEMRTGASSRRPDLVVLDTYPSELRFVDVAPLVVVEVLSASTRREDLLFKSLEYLAFGARQYWLVEPEGETSVEVLENRGTTWASVAVVDAGHPVADVAVGGAGTVHLDHAALFAT
jgi:Uma2 family endonuclease